MVARPVQRYAIHFADLDPVRGREIAKRRPVVVISRAEMNRFSDTVVVCPITSTLHPTWRSRIGFLCAGRQAEIAVDQIRTVSKQRLGRRIDMLDAAVAAELRRLVGQMYAEG
jgi:mRNA interferase MazF